MSWNKVMIQHESLLCKIQFKNLYKPVTFFLSLVVLNLLYMFAKSLYGIQCFVINKCMDEVNCTGYCNLWPLKFFFSKKLTFLHFCYHSGLSWDFRWRICTTPVCSITGHRLSLWRKLYCTLWIRCTGDHYECIVWSMLKNIMQVFRSDISI